MVEPSVMVAFDFTRMIFKFCGSQITGFSNYDTAVRIENLRGKTRLVLSLPVSSKSVEKLIHMTGYWGDFEINYEGDYESKLYFKEKLRLTGSTTYISPEGVVFSFCFEKDD